MREACFSLVLLVAACGDNLTHPDGPPAYQGPDASLACLPNLDGKSEASEVYAGLGIPA